MATNKSINMTHFEKGKLYKPNPLVLTKYDSLIAYGKEDNKIYAFDKNTKLLYLGDVDIPNVYDGTGFNAKQLTNHCFLHGEILVVIATVAAGDWIPFE